MTNVRAILIVGGSGFLGSQLALKLREGYKVFATHFTHPIKIPGVTFFPMNLEDRNWVRKAVRTTLPDVVIYVAGNNKKESVDQTNRSAERVHTVGPATIASSADILQPRFIYLSNPYVFDGSKGNYHESDTVLPDSILGRIKLGGENVVKSKCLNYVIIRSSPIFGRSAGNNLSFLDQLRMNLDRQQRLEIMGHELHSFAPIEGLCDLISRLIDSGIRNRVLHYGGLTKVSYLDFAKSFAKHFGYDPSLISRRHVPQLKMSTQEDDFTHDFSLNSTQVMETLKVKSFLLEESFDLIQKQLVTHL